MPTHSEDTVFRLVKSLSKAEKRHFKLYVNRLAGAEDVLFMRLFILLDKLPQYQEEIILEKIPEIKRQQLSNLKRHLYGQLLTSLRLLGVSKMPALAITEQIDFARLLYSKGLYLQSLKLLDKAKGMAQVAHKDLLELEIIEFEKIIEARHITRSIENRAEQLTKESERRKEVIASYADLSNLALRLYGLYLKFGHARNERDLAFVKDYFEKNIPAPNGKPLTFIEKIHLYQAHVWYSHIIQNFSQYYRYSSKWVELFQQNPNMLEVDPDLYLRGINNLLTASFFTGYQSKLKETLASLDQFQKENEKKLDVNSKILAFQYYYTGLINLHFIQGTFSEGIKFIPDLEKKLKEYAPYLDQHRILVFYYKMACLFFGSGDNARSLDYLNQIINLKAGTLREDIQCYARFLHLIAHYELGNYNLLEYLVKSVYRFLAKMDDLSLVQEEILKFLRQTLHRDKRDLREAFINLRTRLTPYAEDEVERRAFLYLDILGWLDSKIENRPVQDIIREKYLKNLR